MSHRVRLGLRRLAPRGRPWAGALALAVVAVARPAPAAAELQAGGWLGARFFSDNARLGFVDGAPIDTELKNGVELGARLAFPIPRVSRYLVPEVELPLSVTTIARFGGTVLWTAPRAHLRLELRPGERLAPFVVVGGGASIALSSASDVYATSIQGHGYVGGGLLFAFRSRVSLRFDARIAVEAGVDPPVAIEGEFGFGVVMPLGGPKVARGPSAPPPVADADGDGIPDERDECPTRAEDRDEFEDDDGCPDIDNDLDRVLDVVDACASVPESINGFEDEDGCPDVVPAEVEALLGPIAGLSFAAGESELPEGATAALGKLVAMLTAQPSLKLVLIGHAALGDIPVEFDDEGEALDPEPVATLLSVERARAVQRALLRLGVPTGRLDVEGHGLAEPRAPGATPRELARNRRVEVRLFVPPR
ncbi:MAG: OmpA family protein [Kofleriaceae bacterium]